MPPETPSLESARWLIGAWLFVFGGVIGSFLNVVIYRLPAGMSLIEPGSHCPACKKPVRWFDNLPILGWIVLRGRCRDCGAKISPRYPVVEAITAALFLVLGWVECLGGGANLPLRPIELAGEVVFPSRIPGELWGIYAYQLLLLCTLLVAALIDYDGHQVPRRLILPGLLVGFAAPLSWPDLRPVPAVPGLDGWLAGLVDGTAGLAAGLVVGLLAWRLMGRKQPWETILGPALVGLFLGWQAAVGVMLVTGALGLLWLFWARCCPEVRRLPQTIWLALAALAWILGWARLAAGWPFLS